jgi:hypothetical protein
MADCAGLILLVEMVLNPLHPKQVGFLSAA